MDPADIANRFSFHPADTPRGNQHAFMRNECHILANTLNDVLPEGQEKSLAVTKLEEVMFWANAAIARQRGDAPAPIDVTAFGATAPEYIAAAPEPDRS